MRISFDVVAPPYTTGPNFKATFEPKPERSREAWTPKKIWTDFQQTPQGCPYRLKKWSCTVEARQVRGDRHDNGPPLGDGDAVRFYVVPRRGKHK